MNTNSLAAAAAKITSAAKGDPAEKERQRQAGDKPIPATKVVADFLAKYRELLSAVTGDPKEAAKFMGNVVNVVASDPKLIRAVRECPASLAGAVVQAATLGLEPNTPLQQCFLIPYFEKDKLESKRAGSEVYRMRVSLQLGYQGVLRLAYNSGEIVDVDAMAVGAKDFFDVQYGTDKHLVHRPYDGPDDNPVVRYYAIVSLKTGGKIFRVWSVPKVAAHAMQFSKSYNDKYGKFFGPWADNFDSMAKKTVLLDSLKYAPKSAKLALQLAADSTTKTLPVTAGASVNVLALPNEEYDENGEAAPAKALPDEPVAQIADKPASHPEPQPVAAAKTRAPAQDAAELDLNDVR